MKLWTFIFVLAIIFAIVDAYVNYRATEQHPDEFEPPDLQGNPENPFAPNPQGRQIVSEIQREIASGLVSLTRNAPAPPIGMPTPPLTSAPVREPEFEQGFAVPPIDRPPIILVSNGAYPTTNRPLSSGRFSSDSRERGRGEAVRISQSDYNPTRVRPTFSSSIRPDSAVTYEEERALRGNLRGSSRTPATFVANELNPEITDDRSGSVRIGQSRYKSNRVYGSRVRPTASSTTTPAPFIYEQGREFGSKPRGSTRRPTTFDNNEEWTYNNQITDNTGDAGRFVESSTDYERFSRIKSRPTSTNAISTSSTTYEQESTLRGNPRGSSRRPATFRHNEKYAFNNQITEDSRGQSISDSKRFSGATFRPFSSTRIPTSSAIYEQEGAPESNPRGSPRRPSTFRHKEEWGFNNQITEDSRGQSISDSKRFSGVTFRPFSSTTISTSSEIYEQEGTSGSNSRESPRRPTAFASHEELSSNNEYFESTSEYVRVGQSGINSEKFSGPISSTTRSSTASTFEKETELDGNTVSAEEVANYLDNEERPINPQVNESDSSETNHLISSQILSSTQTSLDGSLPDQDEIVVTSPGILPASETWTESYHFDSIITTPATVGDVSTEDSPSAQPNTGGSSIDANTNLRIVSEISSSNVATNVSPGTETVIKNLSSELRRPSDTEDESVQVLISEQRRSKGPFDGFHTTSKFASTSSETIGSSGYKAVEDNSNVRLPSALDDVSTERSSSIQQSLNELTDAVTPSSEEVSSYDNSARGIEINYNASNDVMEPTFDEVLPRESSSELPKTNESLSDDLVFSDGTSGFSGADSGWGNRVISDKDNSDVPRPSAVDHQTNIGLSSLDQHFDQLSTGSYTTPSGVSENDGVDSGLFTSSDSQTTLNTTDHNIRSPDQSDEISEGSRSLQQNPKYDVSSGSFTSSDSQTVLKNNNHNTISNYQSDVVSEQLRSSQQNPGGSHTHSHSNSAEVSSAVNPIGNGNNVAETQTTNQNLGNPITRPSAPGSSVSEIMTPNIANNATSLIGNTLGFPGGFTSALAFTNLPSGLIGRTIERIERIERIRIQ